MQVILVTYSGPHGGPDAVCASQEAARQWLTESRGKIIQDDGFHVLVDNGLWNVSYDLVVAEVFEEK
jgi:hypothetical protein